MADIKPCNSDCPQPASLRCYIDDTPYTDGRLSTSDCTSCVASVGTIEWDGFLIAKDDSCVYVSDLNILKIDGKAIQFIFQILIYRTLRSALSVRTTFCRQGCGVWVFVAMCSGTAACDQAMDPYVMYRGHNSNQRPEGLYPYVQGCEQSYNFIEFRAEEKAT